MGWLLNKNIGTNDLLRAEQEVLLARQVQAMIAFQSVRGDLAAQLGCIPTNSEWATAVGLDERVLQHMLMQGHHSKRVMASST